MRFGCLISSCLLFETKFETFHLLYAVFEIFVHGIRKLELLSSITDFELVLKSKMEVELSGIGDPNL